MDQLLKMLTIELFFQCYYDLNCIRKLRKGDPLIVFQMGKVGSKSIYNSLKKSAIKSIFHTHYLNYNHQYAFIRRLYELVVNQKKPTRIISLTREPFSRNVSAFFETLPRYAISNTHHVNTDDLANIFFHKFYHDEPLLWFDTQLKRVTGFDVYQHQLIDNQYIAGSSRNFKILVLKSELSNSLKEEIISNFLNIKFKIRNANLTKDKQISTTYTDFKKRIAYDENFVSAIIKSRYFDHFYGSDQNEILSKLNITSNTIK
ncbi:MAG: putative capsular polysaccharide synthesis family protein [Thermodesulfobacteriota bacterium]|nr:putative capsular polysaccharide synthesis family protein [Thermodesulfobacteriota bacterium]